MNNIIGLVYMEEIYLTVLPLFRLTCSFNERLFLKNNAWNENIKDIFCIFLKNFVYINELLYVIFLLRLNIDNSYE